MKNLKAVFKLAKKRKVTDYENIIIESILSEDNVPLENEHNVDFIYKWGVSDSVDKKIDDYVKRLSKAIDRSKSD